MENNQLIFSSKVFEIFDKTLEVPKELDIFNTYRLMFRELANEAANDLEVEYMATMNNLDGFLQFFPELYNRKLEPLIKKCVDILISEGVWTVTYESFLSQHLNDFHLAMDDYKVMMENFNATLEANQQRTANNWSYVPNLVGGGFGIFGVLKGIATATAYNVIRDGIEASAIQNANVKPEQRIEIYKNLNLSILFDRVFTDYWRTFLSLVWTLRQNGKDIWWPSDEETQKSNNIFANITNPNFPQDKILEVMLQIIKANPYNIEYYKFITAKFGDTPQISSLKNYFGYTVFDNPRIV